MREPSASRCGRVRPVHRHAWLWEPLESDVTLVVRPMFGAKAAYLDGKLMLCFCTGAEPWNGVLVCTDRSHHPALVAEFPELTPHAILPKWLYLTEAADSFERTARHLVTLARARDPRLGVAPKPKHKSAKSPRRRLDRPGL